MKMQDIEGERELYFTKLSKLDQFIGEKLRQGNQEIEGNGQLIEYLGKIQQIILDDEDQGVENIRDENVGKSVEQMDLSS